MFNTKTVHLCKMQTTQITLCWILLLRKGACYLLFKVSSVLFIHQHQVKEVAYRELLVDIPHGGCQVISCKETED